MSAGLRDQLQQLVALVGDALDAVESTVLNAEEAVEVCGLAQQVENMVGELQRRLICKVDDDGLWAAVGDRSPASWLARQCRVRRSVASARLRSGRALRLLPIAAKSAECGELTAEHVQLLADCRRAAPDLLDNEAEAMLVDMALMYPVDGFARCVRHWRSLAEAIAPDPSGNPDESERARLHLSLTLDGWWKLDALLSPADGELVNALIDAEVDRYLRSKRDGDPSVTPLSPGAVRAAALVDLVAQSARRAPSDNSVADRYRVALLVKQSEPLSAVAAEAVCDADWFRVVIGQAGKCSMSDGRPGSGRRRYNERSVFVTVAADGLAVTVRLLGVIFIIARNGRTTARHLFKMVFSCAVGTMDICIGTAGRFTWTSNNNQSSPNPASDVYQSHTGSADAHGNTTRSSSTGLNAPPLALMR